MSKKVIIVAGVVIIIIILAFIWYSLIDFDPYGDPDKDGLTNEQEKILGSNINEMDLFIEVDFIDGYQNPYVAKSLENLTAYYAERSIIVHVDYNSPTNVIPWELDEDEPFNIDIQKQMEEEYHDYNKTHVYLLIAKPYEDPRILGGAELSAGAAVAVNKSHQNVSRMIEYTIFHEIGHTIGVGLYDDIGDTEVYCTSANCSMGSGLHAYCDKCWESVFAPKDKYGTSVRAQTRLWDKWSVDEPASLNN
jgi:hypothetical protein